MVANSQNKHTLKTFQKIKMVKMIVNNFIYLFLFEFWLSN